MSSENNQDNSSSNPVGNSTESTQQGWMELDQQGVAGETLKAKTWTTKRRLVDDSSSQGNIHTGTEATVELNKSDTLTGDASDYQSVANEERETQDNEGSEQLAGESQRVSPNMGPPDRSEATATKSAAYESVTEAESLVTSSGSDTLTFEEHFDEATSRGERSATENNSTTRLAQPAVVETPPEEIPQENSQDTKTSPASEPQPKTVLGEPATSSTTVPTTAPDSSPATELEPDPEIIIESSASAPILTTTDAIGIEDTMIAIDISSQLTDTDGSESLAITIGGVPQGAFLSAGTNLGNGAWKLTPDQLDNLSLTPPVNSDENFSLTVTATSTESHGGQQNSKSEIIDFFIEAVADTPELTTATATGAEDTAIDLNISTTLTDLDGSETLSAITLSGIPEGSIVSAGTQNIDGSWSVTKDDLEGLQLTPPKDYFDNFEINLSVTATDSNGSTSTSTAVLPVTVTAAPDEAVITGSGTALTEDTAQTASGQLTIVDPDADEAHFTAETVEGTYGSLDVAEDGSWTYSLNNDADTVQQLDAGDTVTDTITVSSADGTTHNLVMTVNGTNDNPVIDTITATTATEDGSLVTGTITAADIDTDDSIIFSATDTDGLSFNSDGSFSFDPSHANYQDLGAGETQTVSVTVTATDQHDATDSQNLLITVTGTNDTPTVSGAVTLPGGTEDTSQVFTTEQLLANADDIDTNDTLSIDGVSVDPSQGILTDNNNGTFTFTPKADYNGDVTINYNVTDGTESVPTTAGINLNAANDGPVAVNDVIGNVTSNAMSFDRSAQINTTSIVDTAETGDQVTVSFDMNWDGTNSVMPVGFDCYDLWITGDNFGFNTGNGDIYGINNAADLVDGNHTVTAVFTQGDVHANELYIDGIKQDLSQLQNTPNDSRADITDNLNLSGWDISSGYNFSGQLDNVQLHDRALTDEEAQGISEGGVVEDGLVAHYDFEGPDPLIDKSNNGNDADIETGNPQVVEHVTFFTEDTTVAIPSATLLANDTDSDGNTLSITAVSENVLDSDGNIAGTANQDENGNIIFTPGDALDSLASGDNKEVSFTYIVDDGHGGTDTATATIQIQGTDDKPVLVEDSAVITEYGSIHPETPNTVQGNLLTNDSDVDDGSSLSVTGVGFSHTMSFDRSDQINTTNIVDTAETGDQVTVSFDMNWDGTNSVMPVGFDCYDIWITGDNIGFNTGAGDLYGVNNASTLANGSHTITAVFTQGDVQANELYIDGVKQDLSQLQNSPNESRADITDELNLSGWDINSSYKFSGQLDNVQLHDRALTEDEAKDISEGDVIESGLVAHYDFEGTEPLTDKSGNDNNAEVGAGDPQAELIEGSSVEGVTVVNGTFGTLTLDQDGSYSYELDDTNNSVNALAEGETLTESFSIDVTEADTNLTLSEELNFTINGTNDDPVITDVTTLNVTEESMEGFTGYGETWEGDVYSVISQADMLQHLGIADADSDTFTVSLADAEIAWHDGIQAKDSIFDSDTLASGSANGDESVVQVTQAFLNNFPNVDAQVGDFYFDHVDFDKLSEGEIASINFSVQVSDGETTSAPRSVNIQVTGSNDAISTISDSNTAPNTILENAADGTEIHLTGLATDADGDAITYALVDDQGNEITDGPFSINTESGVVILQDRSQIDYETESSHTLHIQASSADGTSSTSAFQVQVEDVDIIKTTDLGGDANGTAITFTVTGDHYDPTNIQDIGTGSPQYHIRVNGEILEVGGQDTFSVEANRGHVVDNQVIRDGNDVELVTFRVPEGTDVDSVSIEFINDANDYSSDSDGDGITTEDRNLVVKELNIGGTVNADGSIDGGTTLQAEDTEVSQYIASNGVDVSGREDMPWQGSMTFYPEGVPPEAPTITSIKANPAISPFNTEVPGNQEEGAGQDVTVTGIYAPGSATNRLEDAPELLTLNDYREVGDHGYNYMGGHDFFENNSISTSQIRGGIVTFSDGTTGIIDSASNGITRDQDGDGTVDYEENAYIYYKAYDGIEETSPTTVTGTAEANSTVELFNDGVKIGETNADDNGQWSVTASLADGEHNLTSQVTDENGISSQLSENSAILVGEPDLSSESDSGRSQSDDLTNDQTVTLSGSGANSGETITLYDENDQSVGSGLVDENGNWSVTSDTLAEGNHELSATVTDEQGVESSATESLQVTIDTTSPDTPEISAITENEGTVFSTDAPGNRTDGAAIGVTVTGLYAPNSSTNLLDDKPELTTANDYREVGDHGYNYMGGHDYFEDNGISTSQLRGGVITFSDGTSGIINTTSNGVERDSNEDGVIDDNVVDGVADYHENSYIYYEAYDDIQEVQPVTINGSAEADSSVEIFEGDTSLGVVQTDMEGNWTLSATNLPEGTHSITATATDAAGNQSRPSVAAEHTVTINEGPIAQDDSATDQQVQLDGNNTSLVADSPIIEDNSSAYTVSLDITPDDQDYGYVISNGGQTGAASGFFVTRGVYGKDASIYQVGVADENQSIIFQGGTVENGEESNLTFTYDGTELTVFQDGVDITDSGTIINGAGRDLPMQNVTLGAPSNILTSYEFKGETDNIQIYDTALDASEVVQIQDGMIPNPEALLANYTFEGDSPLGDLSGNGHDLQAYGDIQYTNTSNADLTTNEDTALTIDADTLLANDSDSDGGTLSIAGISEKVVDSEGTVVGTAAQDDTGNIIFTPGDSLNALAEGESADVSFTYTVSDGQGGTDTATATLTVEGSNDAPVVRAESTSLTEDSFVSGSIETDDVDGRIVSVEVAEGHDTPSGLTLNNDGSYTFDASSYDELKEGENTSLEVPVTVTDDSGASTSTTLTIDIQGSNNDLSYVSETAGYKNVVGLYQTDENGNPVSGTVVIDDQNGLAGGTQLADLEPGNYEFFIIANGADEISEGSSISFDNSGDQPVLLIDGEAAAHPVYFTEPAFNQDGADHFQFRSDGEGGTYVHIEDLPDLGDADFGDVVLHTNFEMDDKTLTGTAIDGVIEGLEYQTTSGLSGLTDSNGDFSYNAGDNVTFSVGGVTLGVATPEDLSTGKTFLQDIADVDRTNLNDEYLENMATFLQSIDENSDAYDGIVITDEIREALADADIDLRTASEEDVQQLVEQIGKAYVEEDDAMNHVEDMLVEHTDLEHDAFEEHIDDETTATEQSILDEQKKDSQVTAISTTGFDTAITDAETDEIRTEAIEDLSLNMPSLTLPGEAEENEQAAEIMEAPVVTQDTPLQSQVPVSESFTEDSQQSLAPLTDDDLALSLPSDSLSNLFDEPVDDNNDIAASTENETRDVSNSDEATNPNPANEAATDTTEETTTSETPITEAVVQEPQEEPVEDAADLNSSAISEVEETEATELNTDDLHIDLAGDNESESSASEDENSSLDRFAATSDNASEDTDSSTIDNFSASSNSEETEELSSVEEIDTMEEDATDQVDDTGLNDADAIQEDLSQEPEQVDPNGTG